MYVMCLSKGLDAIKETIDEGLLPSKRMGFVPTAGETYPDPYFVNESRIRLTQLGLELIEIDVTRSSRDELVAALQAVDGIYVAGGNSFHLLQQLQRKGLLSFIKELVRQGKPYFGESAGAVVLYSTIEPIKPIDNPEDAPGIQSYEALGLIDFIPLPHIDREKYKEAFQRFLAENQNDYRIVPFRDDQAILIRDDQGRECDIRESALTEIK